MLEAPEAVNLAIQLNENIKGKTITVAMAGYTPHKFAFYYGDPSLYEERLIGRRIGETHSYGGIVEIEAQDTNLLFSDGANIKYYAPGDKLPKKHQLLIGFDDESCITVSVRMYAILLAYPAGNLDNNFAQYYNTAKLKPQVLSDDFTKEYFMSLITTEEAAKKSMKAALATEQVIPGLGNGVLQDILYNAGLHPKKKVADIEEAKLDALYDVLKNTLGDMAAKSGRNTETDIFGNSGGYVPWLSKDTNGLECMRCGRLIVKENYMGGSIYYCPGCQVL